MILLVCGGRKFFNQSFIDQKLNEFNPECIIQGGAPGADAAARFWAKRQGKPCITIDANWDYYGKPAGPIRNGWMLKYIKIDKVLAFPGGDGTDNMIKQAKAAGIPVEEVRPI